jgi:hypothetical protein
MSALRSVKHYKGFPLNAPLFPTKASIADERIRRADERTRTADLISLRVSFRTL